MIRMSKTEFWDVLEQQYPEQMADFRSWVKEYARREEFESVFGCGNCGRYGPHIEFPDLPNAMQLGIFIQYTVEHGGRQFIDMSLIEDGLSMETWINRVRTWFKDEQGLQNKSDNF